MAIYHLHDQAISKTSGRSPLAMAAYRAGDRLVENVFDKETGIGTELVHDYTRKANIIYSEIMAPDEAPEWMRNRNSLWQQVIAGEKRKDGVYLHEMDVAIPLELSQQQGIELVKNFAQRAFVDKGMVVDFSIHWEEGNPHAHIMQTTREIVKGQFGNKNREWHRKDGLRVKRQAWAEVVNEHLLKHGYEVRVDHRSYKEQNINLTPTLHEGVIASELEFRGLVSHIRQNNWVIAEENKKRIEQDPEIIIKKLSQERATFTESDIATEVFKRVQGEKELYQAAMLKVMASPSLQVVTEKDLKGNKRYVYCEYAKTEKELFQLVEEMNRQCVEQPKNPKQIDAILAQIPKLTEEQKNAVRYLTDPQKNIMVMVGKAGTGKTTTLELVTQYYQQQGYTVKGAALAGIAAVNLAEKTHIESRTLASWSKRWECGEVIGKKEVWIVDEAGMLGTDAMHAIVKKVNKAAAKLILVGDEQQLQPITAGQALRGIEQKTGSVQITQVFRQKEKWMCDATEHLSRGEVVQALRAYDQCGCIQWKANGVEVLKQAARDYIEDQYTKQERPGSGSIILALRRSDVQKANQLVRDMLKKQGELQEGRVFNTSTGRKEFAVGERIVFLENESWKMHVRNGMMGTITKLEDKIIYADIGIGQEKREVRIDTDNYQNITYGYASTIHKVQGLTIDRSYVVLDKHLDKHSLYVAASRHQLQMRLYADHTLHKDIGELALAVGRNSAQHLASDWTITEGEKDYYHTVQAYVLQAVSAKQQLKTIREWAASTNQEIFTHPRWEAFQETAAQRNELAKIMAHESESYRRFLKEAGVSLNTVKRQAGMLAYELLFQEEKKERELVQNYVGMEAGSPERLRTAYNIVDRQTKNPGLYQFLLTEVGINQKTLEQDITGYKAFLGQYTKEQLQQNLSDFYAYLKLAPQAERNNGMVWLQGKVKELRELHQETSQRLQPRLQRIVQEEIRIVDFTHDIHLRGRRLQKLDQRQMASAYDAYTQAVKGKEMAESALIQLKESKTTREWGENMKRYERQLGRFMDDKDVSMLAREIGKVQKIQDSSIQSEKNKWTFEQVVKDSLPILRSYQEVYRASTEYRRLKEQREHSDETIAKLTLAQKHCEQTLMTETAALQKQSTGLFKEAHVINHHIKKANHKELVTLYNRLDHYALSKKYKIFSFFRQAHQQEQAKNPFRHTLKKFLKELEERDKIKRLLFETTYKRLTFSTAIERDHGLNKRDERNRQLQAYEQQLQHLFGRFGAEKLKEAQSLGQNKEKLARYLEPAQKIPQKEKDQTLQMEPV